MRIEKESDMQRVNAQSSHPSNLDKNDLGIFFREYSAILLNFIFSVIAMKVMQMYKDRLKDLCRVKLIFFILPTIRKWNPFTVAVGIFIRRVFV